MQAEVTPHQAKFGVSWIAIEMLNHLRCNIRIAIYGATKRQVD